MYNNIKALKEKPETANAGLRWSDDEVKELLSKVGNNMNLTEVANIHKRTLNSIIGKLLNIAEKLIKEDNLEIEIVSKKINLPIKDIEQHLIKNKDRVIKKKVIKPPEPEIIIEKKKELVLNEEQESALSSFKEGKNIFLTGPAGTGKSVTLKKMIEHMLMYLDLHFLV